MGFGVNRETNFVPTEIQSLFSYFTFILTSIYTVNRYFSQYFKN
jgi:hypothetical protein